jgi:hypothetical protein
MQTRRQFIGTTFGAGAALAAAHLRWRPSASVRSLTPKSISGRQKATTEMGAWHEAAPAGAVHYRTGVAAKG